MIKISDEERETYEWWCNDTGTIAWPAKRLALAFRRAVGEILKMEFEREHRVSSTGMCIRPERVCQVEECTDPRHNYDQAAWEREADKVIREGR